MSKTKTKNLLSNGIIVFLLAAFCQLLWGSAFPMVKTGYKMFSISSSDSFSQILFAGLRFTGAGFLTLILGSVIYSRQKKGHSVKTMIPQKGDFKEIFILMLFQTVIQYIFFYLGLARASGVKSSVITSSSVFITIFISALIFKSEPLTVRKVVGSLLGFAGIILINMNGLDLNLKFTGEGFILIAAVSYSFSSCFMKSFSKEKDPVMLSGNQFILGGIVLIITGLIGGGKIYPQNGKAFLVLFYLSFLSAAAYSIWSILLKYNDVSSIAVYGFLNPVFGVLLSILILREGNEISALTTVISIILVAAGIISVNMKTRKQKTKNI